MAKKTSKKKTSKKKTPTNKPGKKTTKKKAKRTAKTKGETRFFAVVQDSDGTLIAMSPKLAKDLKPSIVCLPYTDNEETAVKMAEHVLAGRSDA